MKYIKSIILLVIVLLMTLTISCERDDICPDTTPTTPSLIIRAYDLSNQENKKNVFDLVIQGVGSDKILPDFSVVTTDSIVLPLKTYEDSTQYILHSEFTYDDNDTPDDDTDDILGGNSDIITISYNTEEVFVSRACGYKTVFRNVVITIEPDADNWIKSKQSVNDNQSVEDETAAHFKIFH